MISFLKGLQGRQKDNITPMAGLAAPDLGAFGIKDGWSYVPPLTLPTEYAELKKTDEAAFNQKLSEALEPYRAQFATPYAAGAPFIELAQSNVLFPMMEWNWPVRRYILEQCHLAWERNPDAKQIVRLNKLFSVQNGMMRSYRSKAVEDVIEAFCCHPYNPIAEYEKSFIDALCSDGELFIRYSVGGQKNEHGIETGEEGEVVITPLRPWYIQWIQANPKNFRDVYSYRYSGSVSDSSGLNFDTFVEDIPADEIEHIAINRLPYEQRGRPELFVVLPYLEAHKRWLEDRARQNAFRGAVYHFRLSNATPAQVAAFQSAFRKPMMAGSSLVTNDQVESKTMEQLVGAGDASEDGRQIRLKVATGAGLAEYMLADGSNANLASATAQALPAIKTFGEWQDTIRDVFSRIFKRVIEENIKAGILPEQVQEEDKNGNIVMGDDGQPNMIDTCDAFDITYTDLESLDKMTAVQALLATTNAGLMSEKTATGLMPWPLDYAEQQAQIESEKQASMDSMLSGKTPIPPGIDPATGQPGQPILPPDERMGKGMTMPPQNGGEEQPQDNEKEYANG